MTGQWSKSLQQSKSMSSLISNVTGVVNAKSKYSNSFQTRPFARHSTNHCATTVTLNMKSLSHAKTAEFGKDVMQVEISPSAAYRDKFTCQSTETKTR